MIQIPLIPAKAGIHEARAVLCFWIPAFAGMSVEKMILRFCNRRQRRDCQYSGDGRHA